MIDSNHVFVVAEIGINHNGDINIAKRLIAGAHGIGCDAVKFQKRTIDVVYSPEELTRPRESVFGNTNGDLKYGLEFGKTEYDEIDALCKSLNIPWFGSPWDEASVDFLLEYDVPYLKIGSASVTDRDLLAYCCASGKPLLVSTGMCDLGMIHKVVEFISMHDAEIACLYHCNSTYPTRDPAEINLLGVETLKREFPDIPIGYSGHELGVPSSVLVSALGVTSIERHITLDRSMWGTDQSASLEIEGMRLVVHGVRAWQKTRGDGEIKIYESEKPIIDKLRRKNTL